MGNIIKLTNDVSGTDLENMKISVLAGTLASPSKNQIGAFISFMRSSHKNDEYKFPYDK